MVDDRDRDGAGARCGARCEPAVLDAPREDGHAAHVVSRWLGRPVSDEILGRFASLAHERPVRLGDFERLASEVSGQDLSWLFDAAFRSTGEFDYGVDGLTSQREGDGYVTAVRARRFGEAPFTGTSEP